MELSKVRRRVAAEREWQCCRATGWRKPGSRNLAEAEIHEALQRRGLGGIIDGKSYYITGDPRESDVCRLQNVAEAAHAEFVGADHRERYRGILLARQRQWRSGAD